MIHTGCSRIEAHVCICESGRMCNLRSHTGSSNCQNALSLQVQQKVPQQTQEGARWVAATRCGNAAARWRWVQRARCSALYACRKPCHTLAVAVDTSGPRNVKRRPATTVLSRVSNTPDWQGLCCCINTGHSTAKVCCSSRVTWIEA